MRRWLVGVTTTFVVLVPAAPGEGQELPEEVVLEAELSSDVALPGEQLTARSVDPCPVAEGSPPGELFWAVWVARDPSVDPRPLTVGYEPLTEAGAWEVSFAAPARPGDYELSGACMDADEPPPDDGAPDGDDPADTVELVGPLYFTVIADSPPTAPPGSSAPPPQALPAPARPVAGTPVYTG
jgi:hypothetical protein